MKGTAINQKVREIVYERDSMDGVPCCILCGRPFTQVHHIVERSRGGQAIPENLVCLCYRCHRILHDTEDRSMKDVIRNYMKTHYKNWDESKLTKSRWEILGGKIWD